MTEPVKTAVHVIISVTKQCSACQYVWKLLWLQLVMNVVTLSCFWYVGITRLRSYLIRDTIFKSVVTFDLKASLDYFQAHHSLVLALLGVRTLVAKNTANCIKAALY